MRNWRIEDDTVVEALRQNGFTCERPEAGMIPDAIPVIARSIDVERVTRPASRWYRTDCPIEANRTYTLPDGQVLVSHGTGLELES